VKLPITAHLDEFLPYSAALLRRDQAAGALEL
jgi:hypothetical protein